VGCYKWVNTRFYCMLCLVEMFRSTLAVVASGLMLLQPFAAKTTELQIYRRGANETDANANFRCKRQRDCFACLL
jgi:hypothetical protein